MNLAKIDILTLNNSLKNCIFVTSDIVKDALLKEAYVSKVKMDFKLMSEDDLYSYLGINVSDELLFEIFRILGNYSLSVHVFKNIPRVLLSFEELLDDYDNLDKNLKVIVDVIEKLGVRNTTSILSCPIYYYGVDLPRNLFGLEEVNVSSNKINKFSVFEFQDFEDEIIHALNNISHKITNGTNIGNIKVYINPQYNERFKVLCEYFSFSYLSSNNYTLSKSEINNIISFIKSDLSITLDEYPREVFAFLNKYVEYFDDEMFIDFAKFYLRSMKIGTNKILENLNVNNINDFFYEDGQIVYLIGANNQDFIKVKKEDDFLNDMAKKKVHVMTTKQTNERIKRDFIRNLGMLDCNTYVSYSKIIGKNNFEVNEFFKDSHIIPSKVTDCLDRYSLEADVYLYKKYLDKSIKENYKYEELEKLEINLEMTQKSNLDFGPNGKLDWDYKKYFFEKQISATLLDKYFQCNFKFYIENVLQLKVSLKNKINLDVGTYIHGVLENIINPKTSLSKDLGFRVDEVGNKFLEDNPDLFSYLGEDRDIKLLKINEYLKQLVRIICEQINRENFKIFSVEEEIAYDIDDFRVVGKIDSVLNFNNYYMVIDYKTGNDELKLDDKYLENGLYLQNMIYFILLRQKYLGVNFAGTYKYKVAPRFVLKDEDNISLRNGYTSDEEEVLRNLDSKNYKKLSFNKDGSLSKSSKILTTQEFENKILLVENKILHFIDEVRTSDKYEVKPLKSKEIDPCEYCSYLNVCFKNHNSYNVLE